MSAPMHFQTVVLPGHRIEIQAPELREGQRATVFVLVDDPAAPRRCLTEILKDYQGAKQFHSDQEVDDYLQRERESWDN